MENAMNDTSVTNTIWENYTKRKKASSFLEKVYFFWGIFIHMQNGGFMRNQHLYTELSTLSTGKTGKQRIVFMETIRNGCFVKKS